MAENPAFNKNSIAEVIIREQHSFFKGLRNVVLQADILTAQQWKEKDKNWKGGNCFFEGTWCQKNYITNAEEAKKQNDKFPILYQKKTVALDTIKSKDGYVVTEGELSYLRDLFDNYLEKEIINWWESIKAKIFTKYGHIDKAPEICQFARQCRNACGHNGVNITKQGVPDPVWNGINLLNYQGKRLREIFTEADFFDFWIDFEKKELGEQFSIKEIKPQE